VTNGIKGGGQLISEQAPDMLEIKKYKWGGRQKWKVDGGKKPRFDGH